MKLYIYRGLLDERVPKDVTHVIVEENVTIIKMHVFYRCFGLVSVIMGDNVKRIEGHAFYECHALRYIRLSKTLEVIEKIAFMYCSSLEALFLPSTVKSIENSSVFHSCRLLRLLILPNDIDLNNVGDGIIRITAIEQIAETAGVAYTPYTYIGETGVYAESNRQVNEWLIHHMDEAPFHKLCYNSSITTKQINDYLSDNGNNSALAIDRYHGMAPLHMLTMNPHAPADSIAALLDSNMEAVFRLDNQQKAPLEYARDYNVGGLVGMINGLCNYRNSSVLLETDTNKKTTAKRRRIELE